MDCHFWRGILILAAADFAEPARLAFTAAKV
jgi:hypothetical protein